MRQNVAQYGRDYARYGSISRHIAQYVAFSLLDMQEVTGSIPVSPTITYCATMVYKAATIDMGKRRNGLGTP